MKVKIYLKDPDGFSEIGQDIVDQLNLPDTLSNEEVEAVVEKRKEEISSILEEWVEYNEYVVLELDTEKKTLRVLTQEERN